MFVEQGKTLRMNAPFGPLAGLGARSVWTVTIEAASGGEGAGSSVVFDEVAHGPATAGLAEMAKAVDFVKAQAISRLVDAGE